MSHCENVATSCYGAGSDGTQQCICRCVPCMAATLVALTPATDDPVTDDQIKEEIAQLDTEISILNAALKIRRGPLVAQVRASAADIIHKRKQRST